MSSYSYLSLKPPGRRLNKMASSVLNPLSHQMASPVPTPDYNQQITGLMGQNQVPNFALGTPNGASTSGSFDFTNSGSGAFNPLAAAAAPAAPSVNGATVDYANDPILQQTQAAITAQIAQAEAASLAAEKQNLIRYGDASLISKVLGDSADQATMDAAKNISFSTVAELGRWNQRSLSGIDSTANRNNLFYSSTRGRDRGLQQEDLVRQQTRTGNQLQDVLTGIAQGLLGAKNSAQMTLLGAQESAYMRALQMALSQRYPPAGGGGFTPNSAAQSQMSSGYPGGPQPQGSGLAWYLQKRGNEWGT